MTPDDLFLSNCFAGVLLITLLAMILPAFKKVSNPCYYCRNEWGTNPDCRHCQTKDAP